MRVRRRLLLVLAVLVVVMVAGITYGLAPLVRWIAVAQIHALTERPTAIDSIAVNLFTGRVSVRGVQVTERDGYLDGSDFEVEMAKLYDSIVKGLAKAE